ncbi:Mur ligase family protein [Microbacterium invictum]|uniref:UDP-N-acetylmuramoyl-L-alanyl-D-glutamate--2, 6-diaminopimelate ligase n=1 Tax=Microbacterium invictum TaxID=515415 RepID=A0AA40VLR0_9MICO|nr:MULTISPECIES: UDP-N-acetylmuramyl-tripeptide synthetase [Microbacterium]MBB4139619.1 UDP-N-acetylmuramoyl-L-alanyl-D-glutamate--2,6-diaminopimelate ligase [Microbacterium invictum]
MPTPPPATPPVLRPEHPPVRPLDEIAARFSYEVRGDLTGRSATGVTLATSDLRAGDIFVGIHGVRRHGAEFAAEAAEKGAVAILTDAGGAEIARDAGLPILVTDDPRGRMADLAAWVYGNVGAMPVMLGVTGTNGKTSTVHLQDALLRQLGLTSGMSSSARRHIDGDVVMARLTTPESSELHALIAYMKERGVTVMAFEVSVQAIVRHRVDGVFYDVAGFTNLQNDHMDDFADMEEYLAGKLRMFRSDRAGRAVVSLDTPAGRRVVEHADIPVTTIATAEIAEDAELAATAQWQVRMLDEAINATVMELTGPDGQRLVTTVPVTGPHMAANAGLAIVMILESGVATWEQIVDTLARDGGIRAELPGRTEVVTTGRGPTVYLDFAHTPDGFEMTARAVRRQTKGTLLIMFGADGSRDTTKRPAMGLAAAHNSDIAIVTDHHPRWEDPQEIRDGLYSGAAQAPPAGGLFNITPPEDAIVKAVSMVGEGDAILWFGPGHQDHREIQGVRHPYNPRAMALKALADAGW